MFSIVLFICFGLISCNPKQQEASSYEFATIDSLLRNGKTVEQTNYDTAYARYVTGLKMAKEQMYDKGTFTAYRYLVFNTGILQGNFNTGLKWNDEGLAEAQKTNNPAYTGDMLSMRAMLYHAHSKLDSAAIYYKEAINILEAENNTASLLPLYNNISGLYSLLGNHQLAKENLQHYISLVKREKDTAALIGAYSNMYVFCNALQDSVAAVKMLFKAKDLLAQMPANDAAPMVYSNLSEFYNNKNKYDSAVYYSQLRLQNALALHDTLSIIKAYSSLMVAQIGLNKKDDLGKSLTAILPYSQRFDAPLYQQRDIAWFFYKYYNSLDNKAAALSFLEKYTGLNSDIRKMETNKNLEQFEQERERNKQEKNLLNSQLKINQKNTTILLLCALLLAFASVFVWLRKRQTLQKKQILFLEKEKDWNRSRSLLEGQLEERNRISRELHDDLGDSLTSIALASKLAQGKSTDNNAEELAIIASSSTEMVQTLNEIVWTLNSRNDSLQSLVAYIRKFASSFLNKANIDFEFTNTLPATDIELDSITRRAVYLTAKEAFNNIVKHSDATHTAMNVKLDGNALTIDIKDNGKGFKDALQHGNGLLNMQKNLSQVEGTCLIEQQGGTTVTIKCTINIKENT